MSRGGALFGLLRRPATLAVIPLALVLSAGAFTAMMTFWEITRTSGNPFDHPALADTMVWAFPALLGLFVGQAIRELQHCHFSFALPNLRRRLLPGTVLIGLTLALATREILTVLIGSFALFEARPERVIVRLWSSFPPFSAGVAAVAFMAFWIGVRPSWKTWLGIIAPLSLFSPALTGAAVRHPALYVVVTAPLTGLLMYQQFSIESARSRPFVRTRPLTGGGRRADQRREPWTIGRSSGSAWHIERMGTNVVHWVRAGAYESHGFHHRFVLGAVLGVAALAATYLIGHALVSAITRPSGGLWSLAGTSSGFVRRASSYGASVFVFSVFAAVPLAVLMACRASISLNRPSAYPLPRRQLARLEYWGSLAENLMICGFLAALLIAFWSLVYGGMGSAGAVAWPQMLGGERGWMVFLLPPLGLVFLLLPVAQLFRLRYLRAPTGWSPVRQLVTIIWLMIVLTALALLLGSKVFFPVLRGLLGAAVFLVALAFVAQYAYRRLLDRHFSTADLV